MLAALLMTAGLAVGSFAAAAVLVLALMRMLNQVDDEPARDAPGDEGGWPRAPRRFDRRGKAARWRDFEREFADYVRTGAGRKS